MALFDGTEGPDPGLNGSTSDDTLRGFGGNDGLYGDLGNDLLEGGEGDDWLKGGAGNDTLDGGNHVYGDTANYDTAAGGVNVNLSTGTASDGDGGTDTLIGIENVFASANNDTLTGDNNNNLFTGNAGNDTIAGSGGFDTADYYPSPAGVVVNLSTGTAADGYGTNDTLSGIEAVNGSNFNDTITGDSGNNSFQGFGGNDSITGGAGDDFLVGGAGNDTLDGGSSTNADSVGFYNTSTGVSVNLATGTAQDGQGGVDTLISIENVNATPFDDTLTGSTSNNFFAPGLGNDSIDGGSGRDDVSFEDSTSAVNVNLVTGVATGGGGNDTLVSIEAVHGSRFDDVLQMSNTINGFALGRAGDDLIVGGTTDDGLIGGSGDDTLNGGTGFDSASYNDTQYDMGPNPTGVGVTVNLVTGTAVDNWGDVDTLISIEFVNGSPFADTLTGGNPVNGSGATDGFEGFQGYGGNDTINGGTGFDRAQYTASPTGVVVTLGGTSNGTAQDGWGGTDVLINIEEVRGSEFSDTLTGSSTFGFESFEGRSGNDVINGNGNTDRTSYQTSPAAVNVNLALGTAADGFGFNDSLVSIENIRGSDFNDTLTGDDGNNDIEARIGNDSVFGGAGQDSLRGNAGNDTLNGGTQLFLANTASQSNEYDSSSYTDATSAVTVTLGTDGTAGTSSGGGLGNDVLIDIERVYGSAFNDTISGTNRIYNEIIRGGQGDDVLNGGAATGTDLGFNQVDYRTATGPVTVNLQGGFASGADGNDVLTNFRGVLASDFNDLIVGDSTDNYFEGFNGDDTIKGGAGNDRASYSNATGAVSVNLATGIATGPAGTDTLISIESLRGSEFGDTLTGDANSNDFQARAGNDTVVAGAGQDTVYGGLGDDSLDGGTNDPLLGPDWVSYITVSGSVVVNLATNSASGADGNDQLFNFEAVSGSMFDDTLTGDSGDNVLKGNQGNDVINGGAGLDAADYFNATGPVVVNLLLQTATGADGTDTFTSIERARGSEFDDLLTGDGGDNRLRGNNGDDTLDGAGGRDAADYYGAGSGVTVRLQQGDATGGNGHDTLISIEDILGSFSWGDDLRGDDGANFIDGRGGDDSIDGGDGNDTLQGSGGNDTLDGGGGTNVAVYTGNFADYRIYTEEGNDDLFVSGPEGTDRLKNITRIEFADRAYAVLFGNDEVEDTLEGGDDDEMIHGRAGDDSVGGGVGDDAVYGDEGDDTLAGDEGDDFLDGGVGADSMAGGVGDDTYIVDDAGDVVDEETQPHARLVNPLALGPGGGIDTVIAGISYSLTGAVENLMMAAGSLNLSGTGNSLNNQITGNDGNNTLEGKLGNDSIDGGAGVDTATYILNRADYTITAVGDSITVAFKGDGGEGTDTLTRVERLHFADGDYAVSGGEGVGLAAGVVSAIFGPQLLNDPVLMGRQVALFEAGLTTQEVVAAAVATPAFALAAGSHSNTDFVDFVYPNLTGSPASSDPAYRELLILVLDLGLYTQGSMGAIAAGLVANEPAVVPFSTQAVSAFPGTDDDNTLTGTSGNDVMFGRGGDDVLTGGAGNDLIDGGLGIDRAVYTDVRANHTVHRNDLGLHVDGIGENDTLMSVERITFADATVAYDIAGNGGTAAKIVGAMFGADALLHDHVLVGQYIAMLDSGMDYETAIGVAAASDRFGTEAGGHGNSEFVYHVINNILGFPVGPDIADLYIGYLNQGLATQAQLAVGAADSIYNIAHIGFAGLAVTGIEYSIA